MSKINTDNLIKIIGYVFFFFYKNCPELFPELKTLAFLLHSIQVISFIFQVSPNYPSPCQPCRCDPVGSLGEVCVKDEKYARRGRHSQELRPDERVTACQTPSFSERFPVIPSKLSGFWHLIVCFLGSHFFLFLFFNYYY